MGEKIKQPVLSGWFTMPAPNCGDGAVEPPVCLLGSRCGDCGSYYFPKATAFCRNPSCQSERLEHLPLSRSGKLWSFTSAAYQPPDPYVAATPFEPFGIAAVELEKERLVVLGQLAKGVALCALRVGMPMELLLEVLSEDTETETYVWKWRPAPSGGIS